VNKVSYLPHSEVIKIQQQSQVLLLLINDTPNAKVILPGKFFEYMASRRPILCIGPKDGDAAQVIADTNSGFVVDKDDVEGIQQTIKQLYARYNNGSTKIESKGIERYSRRQLTADLAERLNYICR
jgi:glycosyltransferase involved in cell wall biosynthesis